PQSELVALFDLIMRGDIDGLVTQADKLEEMDNQFSPFAVQLRQLAKGFKLKELRGFVKQYLE
ncbi:MAG: hypothetical protein GY797_21430, partial [Deltaproteobacteria bacterium]|nr:hypothetical protein [Deltaproteobacteria bacterium]